MMSVIIAIFQAILQAVSYIIPVSQSGHAAIFHDFAGRADGTVTMLTGAINIGIALGVFASSIKLFIRIGKELGKSVGDIIQKDFSLTGMSAAQSFSLLLLISFVPMLLWLVPLGKYGMLYRVLKATAYNNTLLDDGVFIAFLGALLFLAARQLSLKKQGRSVTLAAAVTAGVCSVFFVPVSG
ncbi:MAG: undecaprenyl-diphosphate phosphatase, partial [Eubacterium sp.]|nr:undecaprenyl-diphosphate phosphatase [Eubacterium sp.]